LIDRALMDEIYALLAAPRSGDDAPSLDHVEYTLTSGYARMLALESERWRLERRLAALAGGLATEIGGGRVHELAELARDLSAKTNDLAELRDLLESLRERRSKLAAA
jgi:hypothetical protein